MWVARGLGFTCSSVGNSLERAPRAAPRRESRRWMRGVGLAGLCGGNEKPVEKGRSGRGAGGPTGEVQAKNLQQEDLRI